MKLGEWRFTLDLLIFFILIRVVLSLLSFMEEPLPHTRYQTINLHLHILMQIALCQCQNDEKTSKCHPSYER